MTQQQIVQEFRSYPKVEQFEIICELAKIYEEDLIMNLEKGGNIFVKEERTLNRLREIGALNPKTLDN